MCGGGGGGGGGVGGITLFYPMPVDPPHDIRQIWLIGMLGKRYLRTVKGTCECAGLPKLHIRLKCSGQMFRHY